MVTTMRSQDVSQPVSRSRQVTCSLRHMSDADACSFQLTSNVSADAAYV
jgi:hypothetical protein